VGHYLAQRWEPPRAPPAGPLSVKSSPRGWSGIARSIPPGPGSKNPWLPGTIRLRVVLHGCKFYVEVSKATEVDELPVDYICGTCGRPLGERLYSTPLFSEAERLEAGVSPWSVLNLFLPDRH